MSLGLSDYGDTVADAARQRDRALVVVATAGIAEISDRARGAEAIARLLVVLVALDPLAGRVRKSYASSRQRRLKGAARRTLQGGYNRFVVFNIRNRQPIVVAGDRLAADQANTPLREE
jgi:hypothetical protein